MDPKTIDIIQLVIVWLTPILSLFIGGFFQYRKLRPETRNLNAEAAKKEMEAVGEYAKLLGDFRDLSNRLALETKRSMEIEAGLVEKLEAEREAREQLQKNFDELERTTRLERVEFRDLERKLALLEEYVRALLHQLREANIEPAPMPAFNNGAPKDRNGLPD